MIVRVVHNGSIIADSVDVADSLRAKLLGVMFRSEIPSEYALVFPFENAKRRSVHMMFVRVPIDVVWVVDETVEGVRTLAPWTGLGWNQADTIIEMKAGSASDVQNGDTVRVAPSP